MSAIIALLLKPVVALHLHHHETNAASFNQPPSVASVNNINSLSFLLNFGSITQTHGTSSITDHLIASTKFNAAEVLLLALKFTGAEGEITIDTTDTVGT